MTAVVAGLVLIALAGCGAAVDGGGREDQVTRLARTIEALGPGVDPVEARRAAEIAFAHTDVLAVEYQITDPPLVHNTKVNMGIKPRGLCWHWAEDMEARLDAENFRTLEMHRAIANADNPFRIDHSTAIVSRRGDAMQDGVVLDPWRLGGELFWSPVRDDARYAWRPREIVLAEKRERMVARGDLAAVP